MFTNFGECVDFFAPGVDVMSTAKDEEAKQNTGTSMSAALTAGAVARLHSSSELARPPAEVCLYFKKDS